MRVYRVLFAATLPLTLAGCERTRGIATSLIGCADEISTGVRPIAQTRDRRFLGKVQESTARCRGGDKAVAGRDVSWVDWSNYYATGDGGTKSFWFTQNWRGINGALIDLEYERVELIKFNLFDNSGTFPGYVTGRPDAEGPALKTWAEMRLPPDNPAYAAVGGAGEQLCKGALIRGRTQSGICNDIRNPLMGSTGTLFARNVEFETTFPDAGLNEVTRNRHGGRLSLLTPDPQVISRKLFTRAQSDSAACNGRLWKARASPRTPTATTRRRRSSTCWLRSGFSS